MRVKMYFFLLCMIFNLMIVLNRFLSFQRLNLIFSYLIFFVIFLRGRNVLSWWVWMDRLNNFFFLSLWIKFHCIFFWFDILMILFVIFFMCNNFGLLLMKFWCKSFDVFFELHNISERAINWEKFFILLSNFGLQSISFKGFIENKLGFGNFS